MFKKSNTTTVVVVHKASSCSRGENTAGPAATRGTESPNETVFRTNPADMGTNKPNLVTY